jgi:hypothetical protein
MKSEFVLYVTDKMYKNKKAIAIVIVADKDIYFFQKNRIYKNNKELLTFDEFVVKHAKMKAPYIFDQLDKESYFYLEHPVFALRRGEKIDHLEIVDLTC